MPVRKPGKLPGEVIGLDYALEYGSDRLEIQADSCTNGRPFWWMIFWPQVGQQQRAGSLVEQAGGTVVGYAVVIELLGLSGRSNCPKEPFTNPL